MSTIEDKLSQMGLTLHTSSAPPSPILAARRTGNLVYLSGVGPTRPDGSVVNGKLGRELTVEQGYEAARYCGLSLLTNLKAAIGDLDKVVRFVKLLGMVNSDPEFTDTSRVINGCTDLLVELFGERGEHARSAVGMATLPRGMAVEIEAIVEVAP
jgi:enamine deaminase RidA (YjgF/YER057c/UK114 family)